ncbi:FUSC family membrane protein [Castellaniella sp.]|uniref:FUSC family protein n=1 Tax=Castellaniella sp. TaxID=1955812 RepID=UPI00355FCCE1
MNALINPLLRFFTGYYLFGGLRQALGILLPGLVVAGYLGEVDTGFAAAIGSACLAIVDSPGGPRRYGRNGMLAALFLASATAIITGLLTEVGWALWLLVPLLCFGFSLLNVYGKPGGLLGFVCLLVMTLTMRSPMTGIQLAHYTLAIFLGGVFYLGFSTVLRRLMWRIETRQALSVALFATADYMAARARLYDTDFTLDDSYRKLTLRQSAMTDAHQVARDVVLRELPQRTDTRENRFRQALVNLFTDMIALLDGMLATQTDYARLRHGLPDSDILLFARDALNKLAANVGQIALNVARGQQRQARNSVKAELRALEFELQQWRSRGALAQDPELYALLVQVLRRMRTMTRLVERMAQCAKHPEQTQVEDERTNRSLNRFLTRQRWQISMLTNSLNMQSVHFRYALRVAFAALLAMLASSLMLELGQRHELPGGLASRGYWIVLTVIVIMKPGFAITRQRNGWRLMGTLLGCALALLLFAVVEDSSVLLLLLIISGILGYGLIQVNYMLAATFMTLLVMLAFHFLDPADSAAVIGERLTDTVIGSLLALSSSYILPSWEVNSLPQLARRLLELNREFLQRGLDLVALSRSQNPAQPASAELQEAELGWRLGQQQLHYAYSNFAATFYRMMDEPIRHQKHVQAFNRLLMEHNILALQAAAIIPQLRQLPGEPDGIRQALDATLGFLAGQEASAPRTLETDDAHAALAYPLRQMINASQGIRDTMRELGLAADATGASPPAPPTGAPATQAAPAGSGMNS